MQSETSLRQSRSVNVGKSAFCNEKAITDL